MYGRYCVFAEEKQRIQLQQNNVAVAPVTATLLGTNQQMKAKLPSFISP